MESYSKREDSTEYGVLLDGVLATVFSASGPGGTPLVFTSKSEAILWATLTIEHQRVAAHRAANATHAKKWDIVHRRVVREPFFLTTNSVTH